MKPTDFEKDVLLVFFKTERIDPQELIKSLDEIEVLDRTIEGSGFMIDLAKHPCLKVADSSTNCKCGKVAGKLNEEGLPVGFLFYIENGYIDSFEGYTYDEPWPDKIVSYELS